MAHVERRLAALEPRRDGAAGSSLLALGAAARGLALAGRDAASDPGPLLARPVGGTQVMQLHDFSLAAEILGPMARRSVASVLGAAISDPLRAGTFGLGDLLDRHEEADLADHAAGRVVVGDDARAAHSVQSRALTVARLRAM